MVCFESYQTRIASERGWLRSVSEVPGERAHLPAVFSLSERRGTGPDRPDGQSRRSTTWRQGGSHARQSRAVRRTGCRFLLHSSPGKKEDCSCGKLNRGELLIKCLSSTLPFVLFGWLVVCVFGKGGLMPSLYPHSQPVGKLIAN